MSHSVNLYSLSNFQRLLFQLLPLLQYCNDSISPSPPFVEQDIDFYQHILSTTLGSHLIDSPTGPANTTSQSFPDLLIILIILLQFPLLLSLFQLSYMKLLRRSGRSIKPHIWLLIIIINPPLLTLISNSISCDLVSPVYQAFLITFSFITEPSSPDQAIHDAYWIQAIKFEI